MAQKVVALEYDPDDEPAPLGDVHRRGEAAHRLLNDPTLAEAFRELRENLYAEWMATDPKQATRREELYYEAHALNRHRQVDRYGLPHGSAALPKS
jgi:hypothetical protein